MTRKDYPATVTLPKQNKNIDSNNTESPVRPKLPSNFLYHIE